MDAGLEANERGAAEAGELEKALQEILDQVEGVDGAIQTCCLTGGCGRVE